jgi:mannosyltransferase OCH1-like enzyme
MSFLPVSQIFLKLYPDKTIEDFPLFVDSSKRFKALTGKYRLIDDKQADKLMSKYKEFYPMWKNAKYDIMKVDILRFIVLYEYGGIVADLDVLPLTKDLNLLVEDVPTDKVIVYTPKQRFNYEVIVSRPKNEIFLEFLRYVKEQIKEKSGMKVYDVRKGRFVLHTTGPRSFKRFIDAHKEPFIMREMNKLMTEADLKHTLKNKEMFPFITFQASTWLDSIGSKEIHNKKELGKTLYKAIS